MLNALRKQTGSIVIKALLILLIISFGAWGIQDWLTPAISGGAVASVGAQEISPRALQRRVQVQMSQLQRLLGNQLTFEQARRFGLIDASLNELVSRALLIEGADSMGVAISDNLVSAEIRSSSQFSGLGGGFDRQRFDSVLYSMGIGEGAFIDEMRRDMGIEHFADSLTEGADAPKAMVDAIYAYRHEKRVADVLLVEDAAVGAIAEPTEADLQAHHKEQAQQFTAPEYRKLTLVRLEAEDLAKETEVSEDAVRESYDARLDEFTKEEKRRVLQMILDTEEKANEAAKLLSEGRDFATVAKEVAGHDEGTIDLGLISAGDMLPDLSAAAFSVAKDAVSEPVKSPFGWHLFSVSEIEAGGVQTLEAVRDDVRAALAREKAVDSLFDLSNRLEDALGGGATIEEAGRELGLTVLGIDAIDRNGSDAAGNPVTGLPSGNNVLRVAFATEDGEESALTESGADGYFVLRVDGITPPALRPLDTVRDEVASAWKARQKADKTKAIADKVTQRLNDGADIQGVASDFDLAFKETKPFPRTDVGQISGIEGDLVKKVFDLAPGMAANQRAAEGYQVARLKEVIPTPAGSDSDGADSIRAELDQALRDDVIAGLGAALREQYGVEVNQALVHQLFAEQDARY